MYSKRSVFTQSNWAVTLALLAVLVLSTVSPALAAAKLRVGKVTIGTQAGVLTYGSGGSVTYSVVVTAATGQGSGIINLAIASVPALPAGVNPVFNPSSLSLTGGQSKTSVLTLTSDGSPLAGTTSFTVEALGSNTKTVSGSLAINKKVATVTATSFSKEYGTSYAFAGSEFTASGFISGDVVSSVSLISSGAAVGAQVLGSPYPIVPSAAVGTGLGNYNIQYNAGQLTVTAAPLNVNGVVGVDKTYDGLLGAAVNASGATVSGLVGSDTVNLNTGAAAGSFADPNVGNSKNVQVSGLTISGGQSSNYALVQPTSTANINPATLTVTANNAFGVVGFDLPVFTFSYSGFVNGESPAVVSTAPSCSVVDPITGEGLYTITCSGGVAQNYTFTYMPGTLTMNAADHVPTDISLSNASVAEMKPAGTIVGELTTTDADSLAGETYSYQLVNTVACPGPENGYFQVSSQRSAGPIPLRTALKLHYVTKASYTVCIETNDGFGGIFDKQFVIKTLPSSQTFLSIGSYDGWVLESGETTNVGGSMNSGNATLLIGDDAAKKQYKSVLDFLTGQLPDNATIYSITLKVRKQSLNTANLFTQLGGLWFDIAKPTFGIRNLQLTDFQQAVTATNGRINLGHFTPTPDADGWYNVTLRSAESANMRSFLNTYVNKVGNTQFRLHFLIDDNNNLVANYLSIYSGNSVPAYQPRLIVGFSAP